MKLHSINTEQRLYVMPSGDGFSCYGFDVLDRKARAVAAWSKVIPPVDVLGPIGTPGHFEQCAQIMDHGERYARKTGTRCDADLVPALIGLEGRRVECTYFGERVRFKVGKSTGWMPAHLMLKNARSTGGAALLADEVKDVRVID